MRSRSLTIEQVLTLLAETPPRIAALTADLSPAQLHTPQPRWVVRKRGAGPSACVR